MNIIKKSVAVLLIVVTVIVAFPACGTVKGDAVASYGDYEVSEVAYKYWMSKYKTLYLYAYNNSVDTVSFWTTEIEEGYTYEDFILEYLDSYVKQVLVGMYLFDEYGLSFSSAKKDEVKGRIDDLIESYGGKNVLNQTLGDMGLNIKTLERIYYDEAKLEVVEEYLFGTNGIMAIDDNDREAYYKEKYYCAMWIYVYTEVKLKKDDKGNYVVDDQGIYQYEKLSDLEKQEKRLIVDQLTADLRGGKDFKELRTKYSEEGLEYYATYPDGIFLSANDYELYGVDMIEALDGLEIGSHTSFNNGYAEVFVKRCPLKNYADLTQAEHALLKDFEEYVRLNKSEKFFDSYEVDFYDDVLGRYDIKTIKGTENTSI